MNKLTFAAMVAVTFGWIGQAAAFHDGGVADCLGCHSMHSPQSSQNLLAGTDQSSTCLNCHENEARFYAVSSREADILGGMAPYQRGPGGDFAWLRKDYTWVDDFGDTHNESGDNHGHNIVAVDYNYTPDATNTTTPGGGSIDPANLACSSCHDQHGKTRRLSDGTIASTGAPIIASGTYADSPEPAAGEAVGVYRLLRSEHQTDLGTGGVTFSVPPPAAKAPHEAMGNVRVAYGAGMGDWCSTCHPNMHVDSGNHVHPMDQNLGTNIANIYNSYVSSGIATGNSATSFNPLVPFQFDNSTDYPALAAMTASTAGPTSSDRVLCLSCHRAHASGWTYMTRWDTAQAIIARAGQWTGTNKGRTQAEVDAAMYEADASIYTYQRTLCNKCHGKD